MHIKAITSRTAITIAEITGDLAASDMMWKQHSRLSEAAKKVSFTTKERLVVFFAVDSIGEKAFTDLFAIDWLKYNGVGPGFIEKIRPLGWVRSSNDVYIGIGWHAITRILSCDRENLTRDYLKQALREKRLTPGKKGYRVTVHQSLCDWLQIPCINTRPEERIFELAGKLRRAIAEWALTQKDADIKKMMGTALILLRYDLEELESGNYDANLRRELTARTLESPGRTTRNPLFPRKPSRA